MCAEFTCRHKAAVHHEVFLLLERKKKKTSGTHVPFEAALGLWDSAHEAAKREELLPPWTRPKDESPEKEAVVEGGNPLRAESPGFLERAPISFASVRF